MARAPSARPYKGVSYELSYASPAAAAHGCNRSVKSAPRSATGGRTLATRAACCAFKGAVGA